MIWAKLNYNFTCLLLFSVHFRFLWLVVGWWLRTWSSPGLGGTSWYNICSPFLQFLYWCLRTLSSLICLSCWCCFCMVSRFPENSVRLFYSPHKGMMPKHRPTTNNNCWHLTSDIIGRCQWWQMTDISSINLCVCRSVFTNVAIWSGNEIDWTIMWEFVRFWDTLGVLYIWLIVFTLTWQAQNFYLVDSYFPRPPLNTKFPN